MPEADETIITRFLVDADEAIEETTNLRKQINTIKTQIKETSEVTKESFDVVAKSIKRVKIDDFQKDIEKLKTSMTKITEVKGPISTEDRAKLDGYKIKLQEATKELREFKEASTTALSELKRGSVQAQGGIRGLISKITNLGGVGKHVFGAIIGISAIQALRSFVRGVKDAAEAALDFQQKLFAFQISVRALQRVGLETTLEEWYEVLQDIKKEFPIFSRRDITEAAALAGLMTREFGFTTEQIESVIHSSASLSLIWGKDLTESVRGLTYAISSGYFESLQRVGIQISRNIVAQEALRRGYEGGYNAIDESVRAALTYDIVMGQIGSLTEDTSKLLDTQAGQVLAVKGNWDDLKVALGDFVVDVFDVEGLKEVNNVLTDIAAVLRILGDDTKSGEFFQKWREFNAIGAQLEMGTPQFEAAEEEWREWIRDFAALEPEFEDTVAFIEEPIKVGGIEYSPDEYQDMVSAAYEIHDEILEIEKETQEKRDDIIEDWRLDSVKRWKAYQDKLLDLEEDFGQRLVDIDINTQQRRDDAIADYGYRLAEVARNAVFRREDAERKYREREIKSERKFQEKLRQLRENFLLDLEDAVRDRDARQIIRLTRQYNLRRTQMVREEKLSKDDRQSQFQEELRQIERQKQERLRQLAIEHERRLQEIDLQAQRERDRAKVEFERRQDAEEARHEQQKEDRKDRLGEQLTDLEDAAQARTDKIVEKLQEEYDLSEEKLNAIARLYEDTFGANGKVDTAIYNTIVRISQLIAMMAALQAVQTRAKYPQGAWPGLPQDYEFAGEQAEGGTIIARKPTVAIFGEAGDEAATFTPLNKLGSQDSAKVTPLDASNMPRDGRIKLEMLLSPDLEARIVDNTLGEIADVNFAVERARK